MRDLPAHLNRSSLGAQGKENKQHHPKLPHSWLRANHFSKALAEKRHVHARGGGQPPQRRGKGAGRYAHTPEERARFEQLLKDNMVAPAATWTRLVGVNVLGQRCDAPKQCRAGVWPLGRFNDIRDCHASIDRFIKFVILGGSNFSIGATYVYHAPSSPSAFASWCHMMTRTGAEKAESANATTGVSLTNWRSSGGGASVPLGTHTAVADLRVADLGCSWKAEVGRCVIDVSHLETQCRVFDNSHLNCSMAVTLGAQCVYFRTWAEKGICIRAQGNRKGGREGSGKGDRDEKKRSANGREGGRKGGGKGGDDQRRGAKGREGGGKGSGDAIASGLGRTYSRSPNERVRTSMWLTHAQQVCDKCLSALVGCSSGVHIRGVHQGCTPGVLIRLSLTNQLLTTDD